MSYMEPKLLRMAGRGDIPLLQFAYSKDKGYHVDMGVKPAGDEAKGEKRKTELQALATKVFGGQKSFKYNDAWNEIGERKGCGTSTAKKALAEMSDLGIVYQDDSGYYRLGQTAPF